MGDDVSDVDLASGIIEDIEAFQSRCAKDARRALDEGDAWLQFPHPSGQGQMLVGPEVRPKLIKLTRRALLNSDLDGRVDFDEAFRTLMKEFARRFVASQEPIDHAAIASLLSFTGSAMTSRLADWDVFIPVRFAFQTEDVRVRLGDVELLPRASLKRDLRKEIRAYLADTENEEPSWRRLQVKDALEYYRSYKWAAKVRLYGCDQPTAVVAAKDALLSAIDCIHVVIGRRISSRLRMGGLKVSFDQRATAYRSLGGPLQLSTSRGLLGTTLPG